MSTTNNAAADRFTFRHFMVMLSMMLVLGTAACIVTGINGIFVQTVCDDLGCGKTELTLFITIMYLVATLIMPTLGKVMGKVDPRIMISIGLVLSFGTRFCMSFFTAPWQFWITGLVDGVGACITFFLTPGLITNAWFRKRFGLIIGVVLACSGVGGMLWSATGSSWIAAYGWRIAWRYLSFACLIPLPFVILFVRRKPEEVGLLPFGANEVMEQAAKKAATEGNKPKAAVLGVSKSVAVKTLSFWLIIVMGLAFAVSGGFNNYTSAYISTLGITDVVGAGLAITLVSFGNMSGKIILGFINDYNGKVGCIFSGLVGFLGLLIIRTAPNVGILYVGCVLFGLMVGSITAEIACITRLCFGPREYAGIYGVTMSMASLGSGIAATIFGLIVDFTGGYAGIFNFAMALVVIALVTAFTALSASKNLVHTAE